MRSINGLLRSVTVFFCCCCFLSIAATGLAENVDNDRNRPNVVIIMADDLGYGDLTSFGGDGSIPTPNIDRLAREGLSFRNFHTNGAVCSPTRASLLTGLYPQETGIEGVVTAKSHRDTGLKPEEYTLAEFFKGEGYQTAIMGKWHVGYLPEFGPMVQGFDHFRGFVSGNVDYQSHIDQEGYADWWKAKSLVPEDGYLTDLITDHGIRFMNQVQDSPFLLYLAHGAPHYPYQGPDDPADRTVQGDFPVLGSREDQVTAYKEMIQSLDRNVGRVMNYLEKQNILEETLVVFLSDNGATTRVGSNDPFRGSKGQMYEGGHHVPAVFYWEGVTPSGTTDQLALTMDIFPTLIDILGATTQRHFSGISLKPVIIGDRQRIQDGSNRTVFWRFRGNKAALMGDWKLVINDEGEALYDLSRDIGETNNVKQKYPGIFQVMMQ
ncbi:MAG: sulfatase-like hydrolase/transferase, partial [Balneolaceae bacterium]|nr:sulfatase-like hydrolase/transferase [Balneolaceae bacterium]